MGLSTVLQLPHPDVYSTFQACHKNYQNPPQTIHQQNGLYFLGAFIVCTSTFLFTCLLLNKLLSLQTPANTSRLAPKSLLPQALPA